jgi:hypothetical protein
MTSPSKGRATSKGFVTGTGRVRTESAKLMRRLAPTRRAEDEAEDDGETLPVKPTTRSECENGCRPCPFVSCKYHLYLEVNPTGSVTYNAPDLESMAETCALDVAAKGGVTLEEIGSVLSLTRERIRQIASAALDKVKQKVERDL